MHRWFLDSFSLPTVIVFSYVHRKDQSIQVKLKTPPSETIYDLSWKKPCTMLLNLHQSYREVRYRGRINMDWRLLSSHEYISCFLGSCNNRLNADFSVDHSVCAVKSLFCEWRTAYHHLLRRAVGLPFFQMWQQVFTV